MYYIYVQYQYFWPFEFDFGHLLSLKLAIVPKQRLVETLINTSHCTYIAIIAAY